MVGCGAAVGNDNDDRQSDSDDEEDESVAFSAFDHWCSLLGLGDSESLATALCAATAAQIHHQPFLPSVRTPVTAWGSPKNSASWTGDQSYQSNRDSQPAARTARSADSGLRLEAAFLNLFLSAAGTSGWGFAMAIKDRISGLFRRGKKPAPQIEGGSHHCR